MKQFLQARLRPSGSAVLFVLWCMLFCSLPAAHGQAPEELLAPEFIIEMDWGLHDLLGFLGSWSATRRYLEKNGAGSLDESWREFEAAWGEADEKRLIRWPLHVRVGRIHSTEL